MFSMFSKGQDCSSVWWLAGRVTQAYTCPRTMAHSCQLYWLNLALAIAHVSQITGITKKLYLTIRKKSTSKHLSVLQLVTNTGLYSVPGRTKWYLEAPWQAYWGPRGQKIFLSWSFQIPFGPSRYWIESSICDNLKHQKGALKYFFC